MLPYTDLLWKLPVVSLRIIHEASQKIESKALKLTAKLKEKTFELYNK